MPFFLKWVDDYKGSGNSFLRLILFFLLLSILTASCSDKISKSVPMAPVVSDMPVKTKASKIIFYGIKSPDSDVIINGREAVKIDRQISWSYPVDLAEGLNSFELFSMFEDGLQGQSSFISIERISAAPALPELDAVPLQTNISPLVISGKKTSSCAVFIGGGMAIPHNEEEAFTYKYSLSQGANVIDIYQQDELGNNSILSTITINFNPSTINPPQLLYPKAGSLAKRRELVWQASTSAVSYIVELSASPDFNTFLSGFPAVVTSTSITFSPPSGKGVYYYRVGAKDKNGNVFYSGTRRFLINRTPHDWNGDRFSDIIFGAPFKEVNSEKKGEAYLYYGSEEFDYIPDAVFFGELKDNRFGASVNWAGDINGDGFDDIIIGAPYFAGDEDERKGRAYLFFGGESGDELPDVVMEGVPEGLFGYKVAGTGDINGDGYDDFAVSAPFYSSSATNSGAVFIFFGGKYPDGEADIILSGEAEADSFGQSLAAGGDINGDGFGDILIGAPLNDTNGDRAGRVYLYFGKSSGINENYIAFDGDGIGEEFGFSLAGAGDVNNDGFNDIIAGSLGRTDESNIAGRADLFYGGLVVDKLADEGFPGIRDADFFGFDTASAGDINNDGFDDIIVSAPYSDESGFKTGQAYLYYGSTDMQPLPSLTLSGELELELFGYTVSGGSDINGDGNVDIISGAPYNDAGNDFDKGMVYIFLGGEGLSPAANIKIPGFDDGSLTGFSVN